MYKGMAQNPRQATTVVNNLTLWLPPDGNRLLGMLGLLSCADVNIFYENTKNFCGCSYPDYAQFFAAMAIAYKPIKTNIAQP